MPSAFLCCRCESVRACWKSLKSLKDSQFAGRAAGELAHISPGFSKIRFIKCESDGSMWHWVRGLTTIVKLCSKRKRKRQKSSSVQQLRGLYTERLARSYAVMLWPFQAPRPGVFDCSVARWSSDSAARLRPHRTAGYHSDKPEPGWE